MIFAMRAFGTVPAALGALLLVGCASSVQTRNIAAVEALSPVQNTAVQSSNLPSLGPNGTMQTATLGAQSQDPMFQQGALGQPAPLNANFPGQLGQPVQTAAADGTFVSIDAVGSVPQMPGRDLSGGLSTEKLLGSWTVVSGADQCKLNLTQTAKSGTKRYRASTPGCMMGGLKVVTSWQLAGSQVQLFDENGDLVASLIHSGNRFIGTLAGGTGISMVG